MTKNEANSQSQNPLAGQNSTSVDDGNQKKYAKASIYTKTGDKGTTKLVDGSCVEKFNPRVEAYGCTDELNSYIGLLRNVAGGGLPDFFDKDLYTIQNQLFNCGSILACSDQAMLEHLPKINSQDIEFLELQMDKMNAELPALREFILPGGSNVSAHLHICRTLCRRAERRSVEIQDTSTEYQNCIIYLNRLSDYFFMLARYVNFKLSVNEITWQKNHL